MFKTKISYRGNTYRAAVYQRFEESEKDNFITKIFHEKYYLKIISDNEEWVLTGFYTDYSSGHSPRPQFERMLRDCKNGKIGIIIVRSINRFSHNFSEGLKIIKELAGLSPPVGVYFEEETIFTLNNDAITLLEKLNELASPLS